MTPSLATASAQMIVWKSDAVLRYAVGFVRAAHALALKGVPVGSDDVEDCYQPISGPGIAGSAVAALREAHIIEDFFGSIPAMGIHGGRRRSKRESANARKVAVYRLSSLAAAEEFLRRHGVEVSRQGLLFDQAS